MPSDLIGVADPVAPTSKDELIPATFKLVEGHAAGAIAWYWEAKQWPKRLSKGIRFLALLLFGLGALPPFLHAIGVRSPVADGPAASWTAWGYLALALGTSALAFDHFFGLSSAYTRYVTTAMSLERARHEFRLDWLGLVAKFGPASQAGTPAEPFISRAIVFLKAVLDLTDRETQDWVAEFRTNLSELERNRKGTARDGAAWDARRGRDRSRKRDRGGRRVGRQCRAGAPQGARYGTRRASSPRNPSGRRSQLNHRDAGGRHRSREPCDEHLVVRERAPEGVKRQRRRRRGLGRQVNAMATCGDPTAPLSDVPEARVPNVERAS